MTTKGKASKSAGSRRAEYKAPALEKGLDIMELLAAEERGLNISELAQKLGRSVGEIFRMIVVLELRGYIRQKPDSDVYVLTQKMFALSHEFRPIARLSTAAAQVMRNLAAETDQSCHLSTYAEGCAYVIGQQDAPTQSIFSVRIGSANALMDSCSGHVLLAFASDTDRAYMISNIPDHHRQPKRGETDALVKRVRRNGYELIESSKVHGVKDIGYPIFDHTGFSVASLVIPFITYLDNSHPVSLEGAAELAVAAAAEISSELGYTQ